MTVFARVRVPATIANLGPGFDCLGIAVGLWLEVEASLSDQDHFVYSGEGSLPDRNDNMMHEGFRAACRAAGLDAPTVTLRAHNPIPLARGLGSSSAALVAGAALADAFSGGTLGREGVLRVCSELEGHPDNVAPAVLGGFTASAMGASGPVSVSLPMPEHWQVLVAIPNSELKTEHARGALPDAYSRADAVFNLSRAALWVAGVASGRAEVLREACLDRVHQPYRAPLIPGLEAAVHGSLEAGALAAFLSGAGPSVAAIVATGAGAVPDAIWSNGTVQNASSGYDEAVMAVLDSYSPRVLRLRCASGFALESVSHQNA